MSGHSLIGPRLLFLVGLTAGAAALGQVQRYAELPAWGSPSPPAPDRYAVLDPRHGEWQLRMQDDCNLVLYRGDRPQWASNTAYWGGDCVLYNWSGYLVVYSYSYVGPVGAVWRTYPFRTPDWYASLRLYGDGGLALIKDGLPVWWASGYVGNFGQDPYTLVSYQLTANQTLYAGDVLSSPRGLYRLDMQSDCNLVLYTWEFWRGHDYRSRLRDVFNTVVAFNPIWATDTSWNSSECRAVFQGDGNLVVYDWQGKVMWASGTYSPGAVLRMQDDGNLVIYDRWGNPVWATNTFNYR